MARHACDLCPRRGRLPVGNCPVCTRAFCDKHGAWDGETWVCAKCAREHKGTV